MQHPLKLVCLLAFSSLFLTQLSLFLYTEVIEWYWICLLSLPLLLPARGLVTDHLYTYKWTGFLTLFYFCIGISELVSNPELRVYAYLTTIFSTLLFLAGIYYTRWLRLQQTG